MMNPAKSIQGHPLMDKLRKECPLEGRLNIHFYLDYVTYVNPKDGDADQQDNKGAREYADRNTRDILQMVDEWINDGMPE